MNSAGRLFPVVETSILELLWRAKVPRTHNTYCQTSIQLVIARAFPALNFPCNGMRFENRSMKPDTAAAPTSSSSSLRGFHILLSAPWRTANDECPRGRIFSHFLCRAREGGFDKVSRTEAPIPCSFGSLVTKKSHDPFRDLSLLSHLPLSNISFVPIPPVLDPHIVHKRNPPFQESRNPKRRYQSRRKTKRTRNRDQPPPFQDSSRGRSRRSRLNLWRQRKKGRRRRRKGKDLLAKKRGKEARPCLVRNPWLKQTTTPRKKGERGESQAIPLPPLVAGDLSQMVGPTVFRLLGGRKKDAGGFLFPLAGPESESLERRGRKRTVATATAIRRLRERSNRSKT